MSKILLVLAASRYQLDTIQTAKRLGYRVITTDNVPDNPGHKYADRCYGVDTTDLEGVLSIARKEAIDGIIAPCTDVAVPTAAYIAEKMSLPGVPYASARLLTSKIEFRRFMRTSGLPCPDFIVLDDKESIPKVAFNKNRRWVLKPDRSSGSKGVFVIDSQEGLVKCLDETRSFSLSGHALIEEFIDGYQGTLEGVLEEGRLAMAVALDRQTAPLPYTTTIGHRLPTKLPLPIQKRLSGIVERVCLEAGIINGPIDCDFVVQDDQVFLLELTPRMGGNSISRLLEIASGFLVAEFCVKQACGCSQQLPKIEDLKPSAVLILGVWQEGCLDFDEAEAVRITKEEYVIGLSIDHKKGTTVLPFVNGRHRVGEVFLCAESRDDLDRRCADILARLKLCAKPL